MDESSVESQESMEQVCMTSEGSGEAVGESIQDVEGHLRTLEEKENAGIRSSLATRASMIDACAESWAGVQKL